MDTPIDFLIEQIVTHPKFSWEAYEAWANLHPAGTILQFGHELFEDDRIMMESIISFGQ